LAVDRAISLPYTGLGSLGYIGAEIQFAPSKYPLTPSYPP
jgi:hypothetical protein